MAGESPRETCSMHDSIASSLERLERSIETKMEKIEKKLDDISRELRDGDVTMHGLKLRVQFLERVVYGAVGLSLTSMVAAVLALVLNR